MGATFIAPAGWSVVVRGPATILEAPEHDSHIALVDIEKAADADAAVAAAWAAYRPDAKWPLKVATAVADEDGWQNQRSYTYETSPNERRDVWAQASQHDGVWTVAHRRHVAAHGGKAPRAGRAHLQPPSSEGLPSRDLCRQAGPSARRSAHRGALGVRRARAGPTGCTRRCHRTGPERQGRPRDRLRRPRPREAGEGRRRHALHDRVEHQGDDDAAPRGPRRRGKTRMGHAGHQPPAVVQARRRGRPRDRCSFGISICACTGLPRQDFEWLLEFKNATPESALAVLGTIQPTSKFGEMFQYSNGLAAAAGYVAGHVAFPELELGAAYDRAMADRVFGPLAMSATTFDFARALAIRSRVPARARHRRQARGRRHGRQLCDRAGTSGWWCMEQRPRRSAVRDDGARAWRVARRHALHP